MPAEPLIATTATSPRRVTLGLIALWVMLVGASVVGKRPNACMVPMEAGSGSICPAVCPAAGPESYSWLPASSGALDQRSGLTQPAAGGPVPTFQAPLEPLGSQIDERLGQGMITP
jgi:hypothetical protein